MANPHPAEHCPGFITDLVLRCAQQDQDALGRLFDLLLPLVLAEVGNGTPSVETDAQAVATFRRIWLYAARFDPADDVVHWILQHAHEVRDQATPLLAG